MFSKSEVTASSNLSLDKLSDGQLLSPMFYVKLRLPLCEVKLKHFLWLPQIQTHMIAVSCHDSVQNIVVEARLLFPTNCRNCLSDEALERAFDVERTTGTGVAQVSCKRVQRNRKAQD
jgi:hypothetical protein